MKLFDFKEKKMEEQKELAVDFLQMQNYFLLCRSSEVASVQKIIHLDESTVRECMNLDESVRFEGLDGYDFISMVYLEEHNCELHIREINIYVFKSGIILVMPDESDGLLQQAQESIVKQIMDLAGQNDPLNIVLYIIFHTLLMDSSNLLEKIEDDMEQLQEEIMLHVEQVHFMQINHYRQLTYTIRKQMRALSYLGAQLLVNQNNLISHNYLRYFHNVEERLQKQYDLSVSLYELSNQLQVSYDSRMTAKTTDAVNKLTIITIFFGPLTVVTGIYGMNFLHMPELKWAWGYPVALGVMVLITGIIYFIIKRKKWL